MLLKGALNIKSLQQALDVIVARHEALRITFAAVDGNPMQVIAKNRSVALPVMDISEHPDTESETAVQRLLKADAQRPFNLAQDVMLRTTLLRRGEREHVLLLTVHHIAADGWSMGVLFRDLSLLYDAFSTGKSSPFPALPIQYADFAVWQREWFQGEVLGGQLACTRIAHRPTSTAGSDLPGARQSIMIPTSLSESLKALSQREGCTLFMTLLAAFKTLLHCYTEQEDVVVGSPIANRNRVEMEDLIGFFVNTLVLRTDLSGNPTFRELLARVREVGGLRCLCSPGPAV